MWTPSRARSPRLSRTESTHRPGRRLTGSLSTVSLAVLAACASQERPQRLAEVRALLDRTSVATAGASSRADEPAALTADSGPDDYILYALLSNPGLEAAYAEYHAATEEVAQATALPDPRLAYRYYVEEVETRVGPQRQAFGLTQALPWFGTLSLRGEVAEQAALALRERFESRKLSLVLEVRDAFHEYYYLARAIEVVRENRDLVRYLEGVARVRYSAGSVDYPDVIRAQVELGKLEDRLTSLEDRRAPVRARLNAALNRPSTAELPFPRTIVRQTLDVDEARVVAWMEENNPELLALHHEVEGAERSIDLAKKQFFPDLAVGVDLVDTGDARMPGISGSGDDALMFGVTLSLPVQRKKYGGAVREAESRLRAATMRREDLANTLAARVASALYGLRDSERKIDLFGTTLLPRAEQSLAATETAYRGGSATFSDLVDAERVLLEFELSYERALADQGRARAELERLVGRPLPFRTIEDDDTTTETDG